LKAGFTIGKLPEYLPPYVFSLLLNVILSHKKKSDVSDSTVLTFNLTEKWHARDL